MPVIVQWEKDRWRAFALAGAAMPSAATADACKQQELMAKHTEVQQKAQELARKNPEEPESVTSKYQDAGQKAQESMRKGGGRLALCKHYDELLAKMKA